MDGWRQEQKWLKLIRETVEAFLRNTRRVLSVTLYTFRTQVGHGVQTSYELHKIVNTRPECAGDYKLAPQNPFQMNPHWTWFLGLV